MSTSTTADRGGRAGSGDPLGSIGWTERTGELQQALGASYEISPRFSAGVELLHEFIFPDWRDHEKIRNVFVGPNISYRRGSWFVTATALVQASDTPDEAERQCHCEREVRSWDRHRDRQRDDQWNQPRDAQEPELADPGVEDG